MGGVGQPLNSPEWISESLRPNPQVDPPSQETLGWVLSSMLTSRKWGYNCALHGVAVIAQNHNTGTSSGSRGL